MGSNRRKEITYHLSENQIDELFDEVDDKREHETDQLPQELYKGDKIAEAADRVGRSEATGDRWADAWTDDGLEGLMPSFGGG